MNAIERFQKYLADGVVFDWHLAAELMRFAGTAYVVIPHGPKLLIWADDKPAPPPTEAFPFAGTDVIELHIGEEIYNCFVAQSEHPDWNADTYWPESAIAKLKK